MTQEYVKNLADKNLLIGVAFTRFGAWWRRSAPNFGELKSLGVHFAYFQLSGSDFIVNEKLRAIADEAIKNGLEVGILHYISGTGNPSDVAAKFAAELRANNWQLPPMLDCEPPSKPEGYADYVSTVARELEQVIQIRPIIYVLDNFNGIASDLSTRLAEYPLADMSQARAGQVDMPKPPPGWRSITFWHFAMGVSDAEVFQSVDAVMAFNGDTRALAALERH